MKRRDAIIGIGGLVAGSGALVGTGAFTSVQADRSVSVETAGDSAAALQIIPAQNDQDSPTANAAEYVDDSGGTIEIDLTGTSNGATGVNQNAVTNVDRLLQVGNNGTQTIQVGFDNNQDDFDSDELPPGWGYTVGTDGSGSVTAVAVIWASPFPSDMSKTLEEVRPNLTTTRFGGESGLVSGIQDYEVLKADDRKIDTGERIHIGAIVDTRNKTIDTTPSELDSTITFSAESTN